MIMTSSNFISSFTNFCVIVSFLTKLLILSISLSTVVREVVVAKLVILGILPLNLLISVLRAEVLAKLVILGISPLTSFNLALRVALVAKLIISGILS